MKTNKNILKSNSISRDVISIPINQIQVPARIGKVQEGSITLGSVMQMAKSIEKIGLLEPIKVSVVKDGKYKYKIVSGAKRCWACVNAGLKSIDAVVVSEEDAPLIYFIENTQRYSLPPIAEAEMYKGLLDTKKMSMEELGKEIGETEDYITKRLRLLTLSPSVGFLLYSGWMKKEWGVEDMTEEEMLEQLFWLEDIINALVTTNYIESEEYKTRGGKRFKSWVDFWQNYVVEYYWEASDKSIEGLKEEIGNLYCDLVRATDEKCILDDSSLCEVKIKYNPVIKRGEDREFLANWIKEHCPGQIQTGK